MRSDLVTEKAPARQRQENHQLRVIARDQPSTFPSPAIFQDVLLDSANTVKSHRGMSAVLSFFIQAIIVAIVIIIPLVITQALPARELTTMLVAPPPPPPPPPPPSPTKVAQTTPIKTTVPVKTNVNLDQLRTPTKIPNKIDMRPEQSAAAPPPPSMAGIAGGVPGGVAGGQVGGVVGGVLGSVNNYMPAKPNPQRVHVSQGVTQGLLVKKVEPQYPPIARQARVQGTVVLRAVISKDGTIQHLQAESGSPLLVSSAINAVKQWKYKPYILNGKPVEVDTTITVNFRLS
jgi:protein TonB